MQQRDEVDVDSKSQTACWGRILLSPAISPRNFVAVLCHYFMLSFVFVNADSLQPMLLQERFKIMQKDQFNNGYNTELLAFDISVKVFTAPLLGYLCDRIGRRNILLYGFLCIALAMGLMPFAAQFYQLVLLRSFYAQGAIAISVVPLLADYVHPEKKGVASSLCVFMSACGALSSAYVNYSILSNLAQNKIYYQYLTAAALTLLLGGFYSLALVKAGNSYYQGNKRPQMALSELARVGCDSLKQPEIAASYFCAFLARADSILLSLFMVLWTYSFNTDKNEENYDQANLKASALSGVAYAVIMLFCMIYGLLFERRKNTRELLSAILLIIAAGVLLVNFVDSVSDPLIYVALGVLGLGMAGLLTGSLFLVNTYASQEHRGYISGLQTFFGIVGICVQVFIGSWLFRFDRSSPFNLFGGCCVLLTAVVWVIFRSRPQKDQSTSLLDQI